MIEHYTELGFNFRMTDIQAAVGLVQLGKLGADRRPAARAGPALPRTAGGHPRAADDHGPGLRHHQLPVILGAAARRFPVARDELLRLLAEAGVSARRGIMAAHLEPAYQGFATTPLPVTERLTAGSLILPLFHQMTEAEQDRVVSVLSGALQAEPVATVP